MIKTENLSDINYCDLYNQYNNSDPDMVYNNELLTDEDKEVFLQDKRFEWLEAGLPLANIADNDRFGDLAEHSDRWKVVKLYKKAKHSDCSEPEKPKASLESRVFLANLDTGALHLYTPVPYPQQFIISLKCFMLFFIGIPLKALCIVVWNVMKIPYHILEFVIAFLVCVYKAGTDSEVSFKESFKKIGSHSLTKIGSDIKNIFLAPFYYAPRLMFEAARGVFSRPWTTRSLTHMSRYASIEREWVGYTRINDVRMVISNVCCKEEYKLGSERVTVFSAVCFQPIESNYYDEKWVRHVFL